MEDAALVVSVYPHVDKFDAYMMRLKKLCKVGELDRAANLLASLKEDGSSGLTVLPLSDDSGEGPHYERLMGINSEYCITPIEALSLGQGLMIWLVEILSQCVAKAEKITDADDGHDFTFTGLSADSSVKEKYAWTIKAASRISRVLCDIRESVVDAPPPISVGGKQTNLNFPGFMHSTTPSINEIVCESSCYATENAANVFGRIEGLYDEFGVMIGWEAYQVARVRRRCLREFAKRVFESVAVDSGKGKVLVGLFMFRERVARSLLLGKLLRLTLCFTGSLSLWDMRVNR